MKTHNSSNLSANIFPMIVVEPAGGLANRLRAMDSAIAFASLTKRNLIVIWEMNSDCNCKFSDLFIVPQGFFHLFEIKPGLLTRILMRFAKYFFSCYPNYYIDQKRIGEWKKQLGSAFRGISEFLDSLHNYNNVFIRTSHRFYYSSTYHPFSGIILKDSIEKIVRNYRNQNMIGVHIRRTDNQKSILCSPIEIFIEHIKKEIEKDNDVKFYLATDDAKSETILKQTFPNRIVTYPKKSLDRNDPRAIKDAAVDLFCLANCRKLIGSYWSSFSDVAAEINGIEKTIAVTEDLETNL